MCVLINTKETENFGRENMGKQLLALPSLQITIWPLAYPLILI